MSECPASGERRLVDSLFLLADRRLTKRQKQLLVHISRLQESIPATRLVRLIHEQIELSSSTIWLNIKILRSCGLLEFGDSKSRGSPVTLTHAGRLVASGAFSMEVQHGF